MSTSSATVLCDTAPIRELIGMTIGYFDIGSHHHLLCFLDWFDFHWLSPQLNPATAVIEIKKTDKGCLKKQPLSVLKSKRVGVQKLEARIKNNIFKNNQFDDELIYGFRKEDLQKL